MIGSLIGSYKILEKLGEGGMGVVYKAVDTSLDRVVAIKSLSGELAKNPDLEQRFRAEAKAQANLNHTNIATLYAFLVQEETAWMVMEYIQGETVYEMIQRRGPIPAHDAIPIFKQALLGMGYAHRMGIVHRDIKPSNIMVNRDGIVKVMDFGIAKVLGNRSVTRTGTQMGTAYYMSPEQVVNKGVDIRSDVYSLGVTLYEMLTANVPFTGDTDFEVMTAHMQTPPPLPTRFYPYIPKGIENAVLHAMEKKQEARFQTVEEFGAALDYPDAYQASMPSAGAVGGAPLSGATRMETQTMGPGTPYPPPPPPLPPPPPRPSQMPTAAMPAPVPMSFPPATPGVPMPPGRKPPLWTNRSFQVVAGGAAAVLALALGWFTVRPNPAPAPVASQNPMTSATPGQPQVQVEVPIPMPPAGQPNGGAVPAQAQQPQATPPPTRQPQQQQATPPAPPQPGEGSPGVSAPAAAPPQAPAPPAPASSLAQVTLPAGTAIRVRTIGAADTRSSKPGDTIAASVDMPVLAAGRTAIPRSSAASLRVDSIDDGLSISLATVTVAGRQYPVHADSYYQEGGKGGKKGVLGHIGGIVHKKHGDNGEAAVIAPASHLTFTLRQALDVTWP